MPDVSAILEEYARLGGTVRIVLETPAETEIVEQLRKRLPGVEVTVATDLTNKGEKA